MLFRSTESKLSLGIPVIDTTWPMVRPGKQIEMPPPSQTEYEFVECRLEETPETNNNQSLIVKNRLVPGDSSAQVQEITESAVFDTISNGTPVSGILGGNPQSEISQTCPWQIERLMLPKSQFWKPIASMNLDQTQIRVSCRSHATGILFEQPGISRRQTPFGDH
mgnify:CR=1 FL=1